MVSKKVPYPKNGDDKIHHQITSPKHEWYNLRYYKCNALIAIILPIKNTIIITFIYWHSSFVFTHDDHAIQSFDHKLQHEHLLLINLLLFSLQLTLYLTRLSFVELVIYILLILLPSAPCNLFSGMPFAFLISSENLLHLATELPTALPTDAMHQFRENPCPVWFLCWILYILPLFYPICLSLSREISLKMPSQLHL